jgi:PAS domain-containing protein
MNVSVNHLVIEKIGFEKTFDFLPYPFLIAELGDPSYEVIYVNKKFLAEVGYVCEEIKSMDDWFARAYPDSQYRNEVRSSWGERFEAAIREGRDFVQMKARRVMYYFTNSASEMV